jgi:hypothetical protein
MRFFFLSFFLLAKQGKKKRGLEFGQTLIRMKKQTSSPKAYSPCYNPREVADENTICAWDLSFQTKSSFGKRDWIQLGAN